MSKLVKIIVVITILKLALTGYICLTTYNNINKFNEIRNFTIFQNGGE